MRYLGETLDIHSGGVDHIAVHHTNEIAQSEAATGKPYVRTWIHGEFLIMTAGKMSKSAGTFLTLDSLKEKGYHPLDYRYLCLTAHYRTQLEFSFESLDFGRATRKGLMERIAELKKQNNGMPGDEKVLNEAKTKFKEAMEDDINVAKALALLWDYIKSHAIAADKINFLEYADKFLGLKLLEEPAGQDISDEAKALIARREESRKNKDFKTSDDIRKQLEDIGILVKDTPKGTEWRLK
jgi:cysteinyl-tRNA synthetase